MIHIAVVVGLGWRARGMRCKITDNADNCRRRRFMTSKDDATGINRTAVSMVNIAKSSH